MRQLFHDNYFEIKANCNYDLGFQKGRLFKKHLRRSIKDLQKEKHFNKQLLDASLRYLEYAADDFPNLVEELKGCAKGADVDFVYLWFLTIEDDIYEYANDKCTTIITNNGRLIAHNEDWEDEAQYSICILKKTIGELTIFELFYQDTLGGNSISINSNGMIQAINSLSPTDTQVGIPKNIVARWLSESDSLDTDYDRLKSIKRASGYNHNLLDFNGNIQNIECSAKKQIMNCPKAPFVHTNHFLTKLHNCEAQDNNYDSIIRYKHASKKANKFMSIKQVKSLLNDTSKGPINSIFNNMTIACMVIDTEEMMAYIWLKRETEKGWIKYNLNKIFDGSFSEIHSNS